MSISEKIKSEHEEFKNILKDLSETTVGDAAVRSSVFPKAVIRMDSHFRAEEATLYEGMLVHSDTREMALEAREEHRVARQLMKELEELPSKEESWLPKIKVLKENVEHHIKEEEEEVLPKAEEIFSSDQMEKWGQEFVDIEKRIQQMTVR